MVVGATDNSLSAFQGLAQGFENGQQVTEGQLLYSIDPRPYQVTVEKAKADIAVVEADAACVSVLWSLGDEFCGELCFFKTLV